MPPFRIMTFDGGGVRGSLMATLVKRLVQQFPNLLDQVDMFAGTSTGSVVAATLASGKSADTLVEFYSQQNLKFAFSPSRLNWFRPKYNNAHFRSLLESHFPGNPKLGDVTQHRLMAPAFQLDDRAEHDWFPIFFHNFPNSPFIDEPLVDICLRSAAAPTIFPSHQGYVDGGMMANNPSTAAIAISIEHQQPRLVLEDIRLLSIGTGLSPSIVTQNTKSWGVVQWMLNPFHSPSEPLLNILFDGVVEADHTLSGNLLGEHYYRLNPPLAGPTALDDWKAIPELIETANNYNLAPTFDWISVNWN